MTTYSPSSFAQTSVQYAGFGIRFAAWVIDAILLGVVGEILNVAHIYYASTLVAAVYFTALIGSTMQASLGMRVFGLKVVLEGGSEDEPIGYGKAFVRWLVSIVSGLVIGLGYFWILWDPKKQAWHDKAAGTVVVRS